MTHTRISHFHRRSVLAVFETEGSADIHQTFQALFLHSLHQAVQDRLAALQVAIGAQANIHANLFFRRACHQRNALIHNSSPALIPCVQQVVGLFAAHFSQEFRVTIRDKNILLGLVQLQ